MNGFTDLHTHILPGVDDGAVDLPSALALLKMARENGTRAIVLTPHYRGKYRQNTPQQLQEVFTQLCQAAGQAFPDVQLYLGQEIAYESEAPEKMTAGEILSLNHSRYVLLEFQPNAFRSYIISGISETLRHGFIPIIAHVERCEAFRKNPALVDEALEMGALAQLNADSIMGRGGFRIKWFCHRLLKAQKAHFVASDAHDGVGRPPLLRECFLKVHKKYGAEYARRLFLENAWEILQNKG